MKNLLLLTGTIAERHETRMVLLLAMHVARLVPPIRPVDVKYYPAMDY
jgi:hypothetical protein